MRQRAGKIDVNSTRTKTTSELKVVGTAVPRAEGSDKVSGRTLYAADVNLPGTLWAKILRSPHSHARILNIDVSKAQRIRGVKAILTGSEVQGHLIGKQIRDMPVLCWDRVRFVGDRVAAVAAESLDAAQEAVNVIDVDYESLAAVFDPLEAMQLSAPLLHDDVTVYDGGPKDKLAADLHNGLTRLAYKKGDVEKGFREADLVLEHVFHIPGRHQGYLEPHAALVAIDPDGRIQVWISAKNPFGVRSQLAKCLQLPEERIRINVVNVGGEFGGKGDGIDLPIAYFLSQRTGRPVKIVMTYAEELSASNPAHPTVITVRSGVKRDGRIVARKLRAVHASGAYGALKSNASLATWHYAGGQYRIDNADIEYLQIYTNTVPGGYYRSPGAVATAFAIDSHTDLIAKELGMDTAEFRMKNFLGEGEEDAVGHRLYNVRFREVLQAAMDAVGWKKAKRRANVGRGIALSGRHISGGDTGVVLTAEPDGSFTIVSPSVDQGSGTHTILRQLVADQMNVAIEQVRVIVGDTDSAPRDGGMRASRMTYVAGQAIMQACETLRKNLLDQAARMLECGAEEIEFDGGKFYLRQDPGQQLTLRRVVAQATEHLQVTVNKDYPYPEDISYICAQVAEVEVDPETGSVQVRRVVSAHDVGTIINPISHQGQIDGAVIMGMGQGVMEELVMDEGKVTNNNLGDYKMPTIRDIPELKTVLVKSTGGVGPLDSKPIGEFANNGPPAAIANAVADAVGVRLFELPVKAEKIYQALKQK
ncbi:MAG: xanthine dehydrogenase family protein molybdopterin-binding subunit [Deltaproteobacteria bacterium]|nr:MAG: xanthine dehydrogenase family protein molybdopterin-binding subunit [Deltaproteobacteria bacterium]